MAIRNTREKDLRFTAVQLLVRSGDIKSFDDIFIHIPPSIVAGKMHMENRRFTTLRKQPEKLTMRHAKDLAKMFGIEYIKMLELIANTILAERPADQ